MGKFMFGEKLNLLLKDRICIVQIQIIETVLFPTQIIQSQSMCYFTQGEIIDFNKPISIL